MQRPGIVAVAAADLFRCDRDDAAWGGHVEFSVLARWIRKRCPTVCYGIMEGFYVCNEDVDTWTLLTCAAASYPCNKS
jgi:hypothetical protein